MMGRWKMNKLGFLNFWLYDQDEFPLHDGHILLRGNNAAGKSITTQSFVPFILDGDKRPERLDPFGSRDRKMEFYLLGDNEREESTGYLYLEFRKPGTEEYRTIGVGMRAQRGKGIDFWGFCLRDGRRIGPGGLQLFERMGGQNLPLSKRKLHQLIDDPKCWAESQTAYKEMVNDQIFRFEDIRQYDQLVQLLIMVRAPKLSKDFRPTEVKKLLNLSLQVLTDDDLSAMVSTMEQMDNLEDTLHGYQAAMQSARIIRTEYNRYNQYILGRKGQAYLDARETTQRLRKQLRDAEDLRGDLERRLEEQSERRRQSGTRLEQAKAQRAAMGDDDLSTKRDQLKQAQESCARLASQLRQGEDQLQRLEDGISRRETNLRTLTRDCDDARAGVRQHLRELNDQNDLLVLGQEHNCYVRDIQAERLNGDQRPLLAALRQRSRQIEDVLGALRKAQEARSIYDSACQVADQAGASVREAQIVFRDAQTQEREERDKLLEAFTRWQDQNTQLEISQDIWLDIRRALSVYRVLADWSPIRDQVDACTRNCESAFRAQLLRAENTLNTLLEEQKEQEWELKQLKAQPEPIPPRQDQIQAARLQLMLRRIPCAPFYELVDFAPELSQEERDLLEAQLTDAGLLDALVVPDEYLPAVKELLEEYPDRFLIPGPAVEQPVQGLIPDATGRFPSEAAACLRGISQADLSAETALLPDGRFCCGMIQGRSHAEAPAGFVGTAAREANRQRQICELEERLEQLAAKIQAAQSEVSDHTGWLEQLEGERSRMPAAEELDQALELLEQLEIDDAVVLGYSMGAAVLFSYLEQFGTARISRLIVGDMSPKPINDEEWKLGIYQGWYTQTQFERDLYNMDHHYEAFSAFFAEQTMFPHTPDERRDFDESGEFALRARERARAAGKEELFHRLMAPPPEQNRRANRIYWESCDSRDYRPCLARIDVPTALFFASPGSLYRPETASWMAARIPNATIRIFDGCTHLASGEKPLEFVSTIVDFVEKT